jgi:hypothetical protein
MGDGTNRPILVLGCPRSGTTLLQVMLHSHPRIAVPPENRFVIDSYRRRLEFGDLADPAARESLARAITDTKGSRFRDLGVDRDEVIGAIVAGPPTVGSALGIVLRAYARRFGKERWGDKRPAYYQDVPVLRRLFPDAQFIHVVRDGRDCVASLKRMRWYQHDVTTAMATWVEAVDYARWHRHRLGPARWHDVIYERLVADPATELRALCRFLGEDYDEVMAQPHRTAREAVPAYKKHHERTHRPVDTTRVGAWRGTLTAEEARLFSAVAGGRLRRWGYRVEDAGRPEPAALLRFARVAGERRYAHGRWRLADRLRDRTRPEQVPSRLDA